MDKPFKEISSLRQIFCGGVIHCDFRQLRIKSGLWAFAYSPVGRTDCPTYGATNSVGLTDCPTYI
ncbi:MAG: hypothetical protein QME52_08455 [Bacteroidota bacterium]|nr:hypothetical protein [Bacteroidota bacterium]